jgi:hypothetical protein
LRNSSAACHTSAPANATVVHDGCCPSPVGMKCGKPTTNALGILRLGFTNLVNLLSLCHMHVRAFDKVNQLGLLVDRARTLAACHPPRLHNGAVMHDGSLVEAGEMTCGKSPTVCSYPEMSNRG